MSRIDLLKILSYPFKSLFGSGIGNVRVLAFMFKWLVFVIVPRQHIVIEYSGCKMGMDIGRGRGFDSLASGLILGNGYEVYTTELFKKVVKPNMVVVDVGAHIGYYTMIASKLVGIKGKVFAFEPEPRNYLNLIQNIDINECKNVVAMENAVSFTEDKARLYVSENASGECSLVEIGNRPKKTIDIKTVSLDNVLQFHKVDVIKIDVDGSEMSVLMGAEKIIKQNESIKLFTEFWRIGLESAGRSCEEYWDMLRDYGFDYIYLIDEKKYQAKQVVLGDILAHISKTSGVNLLCSKEEVSI